jgi:hypothetical protein
MFSIILLNIADPFDFHRTKLTKALRLPRTIRRQAIEQAPYETTTSHKAFIPSGSIL